MSGLIRLSRAIDALSTTVGRIASWAILVAVVVSALNAIIRKVFGVSSNAWLELQWYLFGAVFMLCTPWTLLNNEHIRIDILSSKLSQRGRNSVEIAGQFLFLMPFAILLTVLSFPSFLLSFRNSEVSNSAGGLLIWPAKLLILLGFALLCLQGVSEIIKRVAIMRGVLSEDAAGGHGASAEAEAERLLAAAEIAPLNAAPTR